MIWSINDQVPKKIDSVTRCVRKFKLHATNLANTEDVSLAQFERCSRLLFSRPLCSPIYHITQLVPRCDATVEFVLFITTARLKWSRPATRENRVHPCFSIDRTLAFHFRVILNNLSPCHLCEYVSRQHPMTLSWNENLVSGKRSKPQQFLPIGGFRTFSVSMFITCRGLRT